MHLCISILFKVERLIIFLSESLKGINSHSHKQETVILRSNSIERIILQQYLALIYINITDFYILL
jgi:hypothetical protein